MKKNYIIQEKMKFVSQDVTNVFGILYKIQVRLDVKLISMLRSPE